MSNEIHLNNRICDLLIEIEKLEGRSSKTDRILNYCISKIFDTGQLTYISRMLKERDKHFNLTPEDIEHEQ